MVAAVAEMDANPIAFCGSDCRSWDPSIVRPGREFNTGNDFDIFIEGNDLILAQGLSIWQRRYFPIIEICQGVGGVEAVGFMVHLPYCARIPVPGVLAVG